MDPCPLWRQVAAVPVSCLPVGEPLLVGVCWQLMGAGLNAHTEVPDEQQQQAHLKGGWWKPRAPEEEAGGRPCPWPLSLDTPGSPHSFEGRGDPGGWPFLVVITG